MNERTWYSLAEAARRVNLSEATLRRHILAGKLEARQAETRTGFRYEVGEHVLQTLIARHGARDNAPDPAPSTDTKEALLAQAAAELKVQRLTQELAHVQERQADLERQLREAGEREARLWQKLDLLIQPLPLALPDRREEPKPPKPWWRFWR